MNKQDIYKYLKENNIWHEITEHKAVYNYGAYSWCFNTSWHLK